MIDPRDDPPAPNGCYILVGHEPVRCQSLRLWGEFMAAADKRRVAETQVGRFRVSTVFLGLDHGFGLRPLLLFETMIFSDIEDAYDYQERCSTWAEAKAMHREAVAQAREWVKKRRRT